MPGTDFHFRLSIDCLPLMKTQLNLVTLAALTAATHCPSLSAADADPLAPWRLGVRIQAVAPDLAPHSIHAYFNTCPESPDGKHVVYYTSGTPEGEAGEIRILNRATGKERIAASGIMTEDAHRAACQQWADGGRFIVFHNCVDGRWRIVAAHAETLEQRVLAEDRQLGFGSPTHPWVPVYGCHWNPGPHRDLELIHVETGEIRKPVTIARVVEEYGDAVQREFGRKEISIFFPVLSPDGNRVFFKLARPGGGNDFRSPRASYRQGMVIFDLAEREFIRLIGQWGHPSWDPQSRNIFEKGNMLLDPKTGTTTRFARSAPSNHPTVSPDGTVFVTDADVAKREFGKAGDWAIVVGDLGSDRFVVIDQFNNQGGAKSWRRSHPHPAFNADGTRIYYNVSEGEWTRLFVAERADPERRTP